MKRNATGGGNDDIAGSDGDDDMFGDNQAKFGGSTSGGGHDSCDGGLGVDAADTNCEAVMGVP